MTDKINASRFYHQWKGHPISDITTFHSTSLTLRPKKPIIYLAGDSSFDNKYWVPSSGPHGSSLSVPVPEIYTSLLNHPHPKPDIAFWLNHFLANRATALNLAVEESLLRERDDGLLEHDIFIRDHISENDILIVSVGANDIALKPTLRTMLNMLRLAWLTPRWLLRFASPWLLSHFIHLFKDKIEKYISRLTEKTKPKAVVVCMIYYPLESQASRDQKSWADLSLKLLGYSWFPGQLQLAIRKMFELATRRVRVQGTQVLPVALFEVLDGKRAEDYVARVEPSSEGGRKVAERLVEALGSLV